MSDIFISYKREDQAVAKSLAQALEAAGWSVWWDTRLKAGERFDDVIEREIEKARCVIVMWSALSVRSQYVKAEANYALGQEKLVPVTLDDAPPPLIFRGIHTPSLRGWDGSPASPAFEKLLSDITSILGPPPEQHTRPEPASAAKPRQSVRKGLQGAPRRSVRPSLSKPPEQKSDDPAPAEPTPPASPEVEKTKFEDVYLFRVPVVGPGGVAVAKKKLEEMIKGFIQETGNRYVSYRIVNLMACSTPKRYEYTVQFTRG